MANDALQTIQNEVSSAIKTGSLSTGVKQLLDNYQKDDKFRDAVNTISKDGQKKQGGAQKGNEGDEKNDEQNMQSAYSKALQDMLGVIKKLQKNMMGGGSPGKGGGNIVIIIVNMAKEYAEKITNPKNDPKNDPKQEANKESPTDEAGIEPKEPKRFKAGKVPETNKNTNADSEKNTTQNKEPNFEGKTLSTPSKETSAVSNETLNKLGDAGKPASTSTQESPSQAPTQESGSTPGLKQ